MLNCIRHKLNVSFSICRKTQHLDELFGAVVEYADAVNILTMNVSDNFQYIFLVSFNCIHSILD